MATFGRSLEGYKMLHAETTKSKGVYQEFIACYILMKVREVFPGAKTKKLTHLGSSNK